MDVSSHIENIVFLQRTEAEKPSVEKVKPAGRSVPAAPRAKKPRQRPSRRSQFADKQNRTFGHSGKKG